MTNEEMKPHRFQDWANYRKRFQFIQKAFAEGNQIVITTHTKATCYHPRLAGLFTVDNTGVYVSRGNKGKRDYIGSGVSVSRMPLGPIRLVHS